MTGTVTDTISKATLHVTATANSKTYGQSASDTGTITGVQGSDGITASFSSAGDAATAPVGTGSYAITAILSDPNGKLVNYTVQETDADLTVSPAILYVTATGNSKTYGQTAEDTGTITGVQGSDGITASFSSAGDAATAPVGTGSYAITAILSDPNGKLVNYTVQETDADLAVSPAILYVMATANSKTYGQTADDTGTITGVQGSDGITASFSSADDDATAPVGTGSYAITATLSDPNGKLVNYTVHETDATLTVYQAAASISVTTYSVTYDSAAHTATGMATGVFNEDLSGDLTLRGTTHTQTGTYSTDSWTFHDPNGNYADASGTVDDAIAKRDLYVIANADSKTYGEAASDTGTITGVQGSDGITVSFSSAGDGASASVSTGSYAITATLSDLNGELGNYTVQETDATLTVYQAAASITVTPYNVTYDSVAHTAIGTATGVLNEDLSDDLNLSGTTHTNAGTYSTDSWTFHDPNGNYADASGTVSDIIAKAEATITVTPYNVTYDGNAHVASATAVGVLGESLSGLYVTATTHSNPGTSVDTWFYIDKTGNYFNSSGGITDTISKAALYITATANSKTYGQTASDAGTITGVQGSDGITVSFSSAGDDATTPVGTGSYAITATLADPNHKLANYIVYETDADLTVNPADLLITARSVSMTYADGTTLNTTGGFTTSGLVNSDSVSSVSLATSASTSTSGNWNAGTWAITPGAAVGTGLGNYHIAYDTGTLTINARALSITGLSGTSKVYDSTTTDPVTGTAALVGTISGDSVTFADGSARFADANVGTDKTVTFAGYTISGADASDYNLSQPARSTANITSAPLTIAANNETKTFGTTLTFAGAEFTTSGLFGTDGVTSVALSSNGTVAAATVGTYPITVSNAVGTGLGNYTIAYVGGTLTVAALNWSTNGTIYVLDSTAGGALSLSGSASLDVTGNVIVDSSSSSAITISGAASVKADGIQVVGGIKKSGSPTLSPQPVTGSQVVADPLATLPLPSIPPNMTNYGSKSIGGSSTVTLQPGIYSKISVSGAAHVTLAAGTYVIQGGGFSASGSGVVTIGDGTAIILEGGGMSVSGAANVSGTEVTVFNFGTAYNGTTDGGSFGPITLSGSGSVSLTPPSSGTYAGILIFQGATIPRP